MLVALLARKLGRDPARAVAFVALNPLVLIYGVGGVHNDVFFMALLLGGALLAVSRREVLGGSLWAAAAAVKLSAGLAIPVLVAGSPRRGRAAAGVAAGGAAALAATWLGFRGHLPERLDAGAARRRACRSRTSPGSRSATAGSTRSCAGSSRSRSCWSRSA